MIDAITVGSSDRFARDSGRRSVICSCYVLTWRRNIAACRSSSSHGRGATRNPTPTRFNLQERVEEGEWLDQVEALDGVPKRRTTVTIEHPKSILTRNSSPDIGFDRSVNAYRGCEHGCIYCFARPTHAYHDLSPGVDFESGCS